MVENVSCNCAGCQAHVKIMAWQLLASERLGTIYELERQIQELKKAQSDETIPN